MQAYPRPLEAQLEDHHLLASYQRLRRKISWQTACGPFSGLHRKTLSSVGGLDRGVVIWNQIGMEL